MQTEIELFSKIFGERRRGRFYGFWGGLPRRPQQMTLAINFPIMSAASLTFSYRLEILKPRRGLVAILLSFRYLGGTHEDSHGASTRDLAGSCPGSGHRLWRRQ